MKKVFSFFIALLIVLTGAFGAYGIEDNNSNSEVAIRGSQGDFYYQYYQDYLLTQQMQDVRVIDDVYGDNSSYSKSSYESIDVTVDKTIINVGEDTEVTITVTENGQPLVGEQVILHGYTSGYTDENGQLTVVLHSEYSENFFIEVKGEEFFGVLFAIQEDEGVVEVTGKDINGNDFKDFGFTVRQDYIWGTSTRGTVARNIARQGTNLLTLVANQNEAGAYYIVKEIEVIPGQINKVFVDSSDCIEVNLQFEYDNQVLNDGNVRLGLSNTGYDFMYFSDYIGRTDEFGYRKIYVTPGIYNIHINGETAQGQSVFLTKQEINLDGSINEFYKLVWNEENTGILKFSTNFDSQYDIYKGIVLNGSYIGLYGNDQIILSEGIYEINQIFLNSEYDNIWYSYTKPWNEIGEISITAGTIFDYYVDLSLDRINFDMDSEYINLGETIHFAVQSIMTKSGYELIDTDDNHKYMNITVKKPNGEIEDLGSQWFRDGMYYLDFDEPEGTYTINATMDLGLLYGSYTVSNSFEVSSNTSNEVSDQVLRDYLGTEPPDLDPQTSTDTVSFVILNATLEGLVRLNPDGTIGEGLAQSWEVSEDGLTYTFYLRDANWSDGTPITAYDFEYAWKRALDPNTASSYAYQMYIIKNGYDYNTGQVTDTNQVGVKALNEKTLQVELERPTPYFLTLTSFITYLPAQKAAVEQWGTEYGTEPDKMVYSGPFMIKEWNHNQKIILEKNPNYWDADNVKLEKIELNIDISVNPITLYEYGEIDIAGVPAELLDNYKYSDEFHSMAEAVTFYLEFNCQDRFFSNKKIRKAFSMAIDRDYYVNDVLANGSMVARGFVPPGIPGPSGRDFRSANGDLIDDVSTLGDMAITEANRLLEEGLAEIGATKEELAQSISYLTGDSGLAIKLAEALQQMWQENLGIEVPIESVSFMTRLQKMDQGDYSIVGAGWGADYNDPMTFMDIWVTGSGNNDTFWSNQQYDQLIENAMVTNGDERMNYMLQAEKILMEELPVSPTYFRAKNFLQKPYVKGIARFPVGVDIEYKWAYIDHNVPINNDPILGDFDENGVVNLIDLSIISSRYGQRSGDANFDEKFDLVLDGIIDIYDIVSVAKKIN